MRFISLVCTFIVITIPRWVGYWKADGDYLPVKAEWVIDKNKER